MGRNISHRDISYLRDLQGAPVNGELQARKMLKRFLHDQAGVMLAEYALLLAILCGALACGAYFLADAISDAMAHAGDQISAEWDGIFSGGSLR